MVRISGNYAFMHKWVNGKVKQAQEKHEGHVPQGRQKLRLDALVVERGLAETREQAQRLLLARRVVHPLGLTLKPGMKVPLDFPLELTQAEKYVSRGGYKLEAALISFCIDIKGLVCMDVGASTGGFTDCLLQAGAQRVVAVDVGASTLHPRIRQDARVTVLEFMNARYLTPERLGVVPEFAAIDVSFISLVKVVPPVLRCLADDSKIVALVKPQFEATPKEVSRGRGVLRDPAVHKRVLTGVLESLAASGCCVLGLVPSPILGGSGNREYLVLLEKGNGIRPGIDIDRTVTEAFLNQTKTDSFFRRA